MTLCIAEKIGSQLNFVADSRISLLDGNYIDFGVKIFRLPVCVKSVTSAKTGCSEIIYNHTLGICVIGNTLNSYLVKETIFEILQNLNYIGKSVHFPIEYLCNIIAKIYEKLSKDICQFIYEKGFAELVVGGYCPESKKVKVFHFKLENSNFTISARFTEILQEPGICFFGSGSKKAETIHKNKSLDSFHILRSVINDDTVSSVGGPIQAGRFESDEFVIKGIQDYILTDFGMFDYLYSLRGINLYNKEFEQIHKKFHVSYEFIEPFKNDIETKPNN